MKGRVLITPRSLTRSDHPALARLRDAGLSIELGPAGRQPTKAELLDLLPGCVAYLAGVEPVDRDVLSAAGELRVIARNGVGVDNIDTASAREIGIEVVNTPGANARSVAELTVALMLALARGVPESHRAMREGRWQRQAGIELFGKTLGVVGFGQIGRIVGQFGAALGMTVCAFDPMLDQAMAAEHGVESVPLGELLDRSTVVSLHCPASADGLPLIDAAALGRMPNGAFLVNTARWSLMDPSAVLDSLERGRLVGVAIDAFETEPPPPDDRLLRHDRVVSTPHLGGFTRESTARAADAAVDGILRVLTRATSEAV